MTSTLPRAELACAQWRKSTHSENASTCVEVATNLPGVVPVRDSKDPSGPVLTFGATAWRRFLGEIKAS